MNPAFSAAIEVPVPGGPDIQSMVAVDGHLVVLTPGYLAQVSYGSNGGLAPGGETAVGLPIGDPTYATWELASDGTLVWAISLGGANRVYLINTSTLQTTSEWNAQISSGSVTGTAAMNGHLYLNTSSGVFVVAPSTRRIDTSNPVARGGQAMAVDPTRNRLLVLNNDDGWAIHAYRPPGFHAVADSSLGFDARSIAVADGVIWVTGTTSGADSEPVLARLDPTTLRVLSHDTPEQTLPPEPVIVAQGTSLWLRSADGDGRLWCVDAHSGTVDQQWTALPGMVTAYAGRGFVAAGSVIGALTPSGCTG